MQRKQLEYKTLHHLTTSSMLCYSSKYKQTEIKANHYQTGLSPHSALPIRGKTNKQTLSESEITQSCPTLWEPMDGSLPAAPSMGVSRQEYYWSGLPFPPPGDLPWPRDWTWFSSIIGRRFTIWATREVLTNFRKAETKRRKNSILKPRKRRPQTQ